MARKRRSRRRGRPSKTITVRKDDVAILSRKRGKATKRQTSRNGWSFQFIDEDDFAPYLDASWLLAYVSEALHAHHVDSIKRGVRADGMGPQPALEPRGTQGHLARRGIRPNLRGVNKFDSRSKGTMFHEKLTRTTIKGRANANYGKGKIGNAARCEIKPGLGAHSLWLADDPGEYLFVEGVAANVIDRAVSEWLDMALKGPPTKISDLPEFGPIEGNDIL